ncbi:TIGR03085 family metal-binding protein [Pengzhenrongella sp.]|jgi:uncharacterized protein (TIGR03085 family)|uniref:TIGR03085 family metal-binding protein n=1 Tax=Pengzhenrongella sp. TaxID=2888820 RepID=UPI002F939C17
MTWHQHERVALVRALTDAGPDAPTLCGDWRTRQLAAHIVLRENDPLVAAGTVVPALNGRSERAIEALASTATDNAGYTDLLTRVAAGPPRWSPMSWAGEGVDLLEFFVHTEDVRRGTGQVEPLELEPAHIAALWHRMVRGAPILYRRARVGVVLVVPGGPRRAVRRAPDDAGTVVIRGDVGELLLHAYGRGAAARVHVLGDPYDVEALAHTLPS